MFRFAYLVVSFALASMVPAQTYSQTFTPDTTPKTWQPDQTGTNQCGKVSDQNARCQNAYVNSIDDFCLFAPYQPGPISDIGNMERDVVSWCLKPGYGSRVIPPGTIIGAHFVQTPDYVQVTGVGDLTKINVPKGDTGGELDPHGEDGLGNPVGGLVFSSAFGDGMKQMHEWTSFVAEGAFCLRACKDGPNAVNLCQHIYNLMGCDWNMPGNYQAGFDACKGESGEPMGIFNGTVFHQGDPVTPPAHPPPVTSQCTTVSAIGGAIPSGTAPPSSTTSPVPLRWKPTSAPNSVHRTSPTSTRPAAHAASNDAKAFPRPFAWGLQMAIAGAAFLADMRI